MEARGVSGALELFYVLMTNDLMARAARAARDEKLRRYPRLSKDAGKLAAAVGVLLDALEHEQQLSLDLVSAQIERPATNGVNGSRASRDRDAASSGALVNVGGHAAHERFRKPLAVPATGGWPLGKSREAYHHGFVEALAAQPKQVVLSVIDTNAVAGELIAAPSEDPTHRASTVQPVGACGA